IFTWTMHSILTHEIHFTGPDEATGRVHVFNRNGVEWEGASEILDVGGFYRDEYVRVGAAWRFRSRYEDTVYLDGGGFAAMLREMIAKQGA
ncbi:MAG TPA: nuclear transport factor 2 family protein, partial [Acidimicrobiales bacterium]|nr:nuclear transport factor 2 family protein [Acidimicrobiales bacterium]